MDFGNFLVTGYIYGVHPHLHPAHPIAFWGQSRKNKINRKSHKGTPQNFPSGFRFISG
jgi:hypothetical protein